MANSFISVSGYGINREKAAVRIKQLSREFFLNEKELLKVYDKTLKHQKEVGTIINVAKDYFTIACGNGTALDILSLKPAGKNVMPAKDYINGGLKKHLK